VTDDRANHCLPLAGRRERVPDITSSDQARRAQGRRPERGAEFYETYDIQPGDGMWVSPEERVSIW